MASEPAIDDRWLTPDDRWLTPNDRWLTPNDRWHTPLLVKMGICLQTLPHHEGVQSSHVNNQHDAAENSPQERGAGQLNSSRLQKLRGRGLVLAGILLVALTLRSAVTAVSPISSEISQDLPLDAATMGILGMLPTLTFAGFGFLTPFVLRWASLERLIVIAMVLSALGQIARVFAPTTGIFMVFTVLALAGMGAGNVLIPPLVKQYFPEHVGLLTALYVTMLSLGTALPAQFAVPVADSLGWQISLAGWAGLNLVAAAMWFSRLRTPTPSLEESEASAVPNRASRGILVWRSPMALGLTAMFGCTGLVTYSMFAWLPQILRDAGLDALSAGNLLALFAILGLPLSLIVPLVANRMRNPFLLVAVLLLFSVAGYVGLLLSPGPGSVVWTALIGIGAGTFPVCLLLINLRTRTHEGTGALSGFVQGTGYGIACAGPFLFGLFHDATGGWTAGFFLLFLALGLTLVGAFFACRSVYLEDQLERRV